MSVGTWSAPAGGISAKSWFRYRKSGFSRGIPGKEALRLRVIERGEAVNRGRGGSRLRASPGRPARSSDKFKFGALPSFRAHETPGG